MVGVSKVAYRYSSCRWKSICIEISIYRCTPNRMKKFLYIKQFIVSINVYLCTVNGPKSIKSVMLSSELIANYLLGVECFNDFWRIKMKWNETLLLKNHWANFNQTWHRAFLGEGDSILFKWRAPPFLLEFLNQVSWKKNIFLKTKCFLSFYVVNCSLNWDPLIFFKVFITAIG